MLRRNLSVYVLTVKPEDKLCDCKLQTISAMCVGIASFARYRQVVTLTFQRLYVAFRPVTDYDRQWLAHRLPSLIGDPFSLVSVTKKLIEEYTSL